VDNPHSERANARVVGHAAIQQHTQANEDWIHIFYSAVAECLSGEDGKLNNVFSKRTACLLATGLQEALLGTARVILQGAWQTGPNKYDGIANTWRDCTQPNWQFTRQGDILFHKYWTGTQTLLIHTNPDQVIKHVNAIGAWEGQGRAFRFLNWSWDPYEWTDEVPEDNPDFQGLLDNKEEEAIYPDISAELPGVELEED
jgi:hypothetical protein